MKNKDAALPSLSHPPSHRSLSFPVSFSLCLTDTACQNNLILKTNTSLPRLSKGLPAQLDSFFTRILATRAAKLPPREKARTAIQTLPRVFLHSSSFSQTNAPSVLIVSSLPPSFMLIKSSDTEQQHRSQRLRRRHLDKSCHKCWSQNN